MLNINNKKLCRFCFTPITNTGTVCPVCGGAGRVKKFYGTLSQGSILAGKYVIGRVLGKGGFGITYQCYDLVKNRVVAIKEYMPDTLAYRDGSSGKVISYEGEKSQCYKAGAVKFFDEAKLVSKFNNNPNITTVYEFFYENNTSYYVMEYLDGIDLKEYIERKGGRISEAVMLNIMNSVQKALADIHSVNVLHRDISPDNIFMCRNGIVKLIDFGAARQLVSEASNSLSVILKQGFAPYEQYQKKGKQGPWTDIYALGATAYHSVTGRMIPDAIGRLENQKVDMSGISPGFAAIISKMIACDIKSRYSNVRQLQKDLSAIVSREHNSGGNVRVKPVLPTEEARTIISQQNSKRQAYKCTACGSINYTGICPVCAGKGTKKEKTVKQRTGTDNQKVITVMAIAGIVLLLLLMIAVYFGVFYEQEYTPINRYEVTNAVSVYTNI